MEVLQAGVLVLFIGLLKLHVVAAQAGLQFAPGNDSITVQAVLPIGETIFGSLVVTSNPPSSSPVSVTCSSTLSTPQGACETFAVVVASQTNEQWSGSIILRKTLDAEQTPSYSLSLQATNGVGFTFKTFIINVVDKVPPVFISQLATTIQPITNVSGSFILQLTALDGDSTQRRQIQYFLVSNPGEYFTVDQSSGRVFNAKPIVPSDPNWAGGYITISVKAVAAYNATFVPVDDPKSNTVANVVITLSYSELAPVFGSSVYYTSVFEKCDPGTLLSNLSVLVDNYNPGLASFFGLSLDKYANIFYVSPTNGSRSVSANILVSNGSLLNFDTGPRSFTFNLVARNLFTLLRLSSSAVVTVSLMDINDHDAVFTQPYYRASVSELAIGGTSVVTVLATDGDWSQIYGNASVRYALSTTNSRFRINTRTGLISVAPCSTPGSGNCINYATQSQYNLTVVAADRFGDGKRTNVIVYISIINEHTEPPVFEDSAYFGSIDEYAPTLTSLLQLVATDVDGDTVSYSMIDGTVCRCWKIDPITGIINNTRPITYSDTPNQQGFFSLTVQATDGYSHNTTVNVRIAVNPVNKYAPVYTQNGTYTATVQSNLPPGSVVIRLLATDQDSPYTPNGQVQYRFDGGCQDQFLIRTVNGFGEVAIAPGTTLTVSTCTIRVVAYDLGSPQLSTTTSLVMNIVLSTGQPVFVPATIPVTVPQTAPVGSAVANITAFAPANASLTYRLIGPITGRDVNNQPVTLTDSEQSLFILNRTTGQLTVNGTLSRDRFTTWQALVVAVDSSPVPPKSGTGTVLVSIAATNDRAPVFIPPWTQANPVYSVSIPDSRPPGTYVTTMIATDPNNNNVYYSITNSTPVANFLIDNSTGIVTLNTQLSYDPSNPLTQFIVTAYDNGLPPLTSTATVNVQLIRQNNRAPVFSQTSYVTSMYDNVTAGYQVINISATFADTATFGPVRYTLADSNGGTFIIDPVTGAISVAPGARFSKVAQGSSPLTLLAFAYNNASDISQQRSTYVTISINLRAANTAPIFGQQSYSLSVPDSAIVGQYVIKLTAVSPDPALNPFIVYTVQSDNSSGLFVVNNLTGLITAGSALQGFAGTYQLKIGAFETRTPSPTTQVTVTITVTATPGSPGNQLVWFAPTADGFYTNVREDVPVGTSIYTVSAKSPSLNKVSYSLADTSNNQPISDLSVDSLSGTIATSRTLNYDRQQGYPLRVTANEAATNQTSSRFLYVNVIKVNNPLFPSYNSGKPLLSCCSIPYIFQTDLTATKGDLVNFVQATVNRPGVPVSYSVINNDNGPFTVNQTTGAVLVTSNLISVIPNTVYKLTVIASTQDQYPQLSVPGCQCSNGSAVFVYVNVTSPTDGQQFVFNFASYNTCVSEDAEVGDYIGNFSTNFNQFFKTNVLYGIDRVFATFYNGSIENLPTTFFTLSSGDFGTAVYLNSLVDQYINSYITIQLRASIMNQTTTTSAQIWITRPRYEILVTTNMAYDSTVANLDTIVSTIKDNIESSKTQVCIRGITQHIATNDEPNPGTIDTTRTDLFLYVVDGRTNTLLMDFHVLDSAYSVDERIATRVTGITAAFPFWAYFSYVPIAAAIGIIIGLLLLALLLLCCCVCWAAILSICYFEKEPLLYQDTTASVIQVPIQFANPMTRRLIEDQQMTMDVGGGDFVDDGMAMAYATGGHDAGDSDVFIASLSKRQLLSRSAQRSTAESQSVATFDDVRIVAPLAAPTASAYDVTDVVDAPAPIGSNAGGNIGNDVLLSTETTTHYEERTSFHGDDHLRSGRTASEMGAPSASIGGFSGSNARQQPSETVSPSTVTLNDPARHTSARIGATLYQAPSPYSGFAPTQNVVSAASYPTNGRGDRVVYDTTNTGPMASLPLHREILYNDMQPRSSMIYDEYEDEYVSNGMMQPPHHNNGVYQGEIRLGALTPSRPLTTSRSGSNLYEQETGFM